MSCAVLQCMCFGSLKKIAECSACKKLCFIEVLGIERFYVSLCRDAESYWLFYRGNKEC